MSPSPMISTSVIGVSVDLCRSNARADEIGAISCYWESSLILRSEGRNEMTRTESAPHFGHAIPNSGDRKSGDLRVYYTTNP